jgi:methionine sulfoxide reductase heme-binding subunit
VSGPSPLWYTTRSAGMVVMILLTVSLVLGIMTNGRWTSAGVPRFVTNSLHGNLSLLALVFLVLHIVTAIVDSFAHLGLKDALIPFASSYRPLWMGLGVLSAELFAALVVTSLVRGLIGYGAWRLIHMLAYASWPLALLHGFGTGTDTKAWWALLINLGCVGAVLIALAWRVTAATTTREGWRLGLAVATVAGTVGLLIFIVRGPLQPGWAVAAGTPPNLLVQNAGGSGSGSTAAGAYTLPTGLQDELQGAAQPSSNGGSLVTLRDVRDPSLQLVITIADAQASAVTVAVSHNAQAVCSGPAAVSQDVSVTCGHTRLAVQRLVEAADGSVRGVLVTSSA